MRDELLNEHVPLPQRGFNVALNHVTEYSFADKGDIVWSADSGKN